MAMKLRVVQARDLPFLREMLYESLYVPKGQAPFPKAVLDDPSIAKYGDGWGRPGDIGVIAECGEVFLGAAWLRLFDAEHPGYGYVDAETPELGIAVVRRHRGHGIGDALLQDLEERATRYGYQALSLSVDPGNPARRLYERRGYVHVGYGDTSWTMMKMLVSGVGGEEGSKP